MHVIAPQIFTQQVKIANHNVKDTTYSVLIRGENSSSFAAPQSILVSSICLTLGAWGQGNCVTLLGWW
jgi:hypothetical protein